jgi:spore germination protein
MRPRPRPFTRRRSARFAALVMTTFVVAAFIPASSTAAATVVAPQRKVSAWLPWWDQARAYKSFLDNAELYYSVSPFWYELSPTRGIRRYPNAEDAKILEGLRASGAKVTPTITNDFDAQRVRSMLSTEHTRSTHVQALVSLVRDKRYDGLDVDYESLAANDRDRFSRFVAQLATALHSAGKTLSVAVHPKSSEPGSWGGPQAQDYRAIGSAADRVRIMAYDYSWSTSAPGPIAPLDWVKTVAQFAASTIPPSKIELGVPLYGYDWTSNGGEGVTYDSAAALMRTHNATRQWNSTFAEASFRYDVDGTTHTVWYADAESIAAKLPLLDQYGLAGVALWRLGGEDPAVWSALRSSPAIAD